MSRRIIVLVIGLLLFTVVGVFLTFLPKARRNADVIGCRNNLREITQFAANYAQTQPGQVPGKNAPDMIPAGTIVLPGVPPDERLSWYVMVLPGLDQTGCMSTSSNW